MNAIVTIVSGRSYKSRFSRYCYPSWKKYADKHGLKLIVYEDALDYSQRAKSRSVAWQKCLTFVAERSSEFKQIAWIDSDIVINHHKAPNIFEGVDPSQIAAVRDFVFPTRERYRRRLEFLINHWRAIGVTCGLALTPEEYMAEWGLPPTADIVQTGVIVATPEVHGSLFKRVYETYEDKGASYWHYEMRPLSYEILTTYSVKWLDPAFNLVTVFGVEDRDMRIFQSPPGILERALRKLRLPVVHLPTARTKRLEEIHERLFEQSYFLHFAGGAGNMGYLKHRLRN